MPGPNCEFRFLPVGNTVSYEPWTYYPSFDHVHHLVSIDAYKLPPAAMVEAFQIELYLNPPFDRELWYLITFGAAGTPVQAVRQAVLPQRIAQAYQEFFDGDRSNTEARTLTQVVFGLPDPEAAASDR